MKKISLAAIVSLALLTASTTASARGGYDDGYRHHGGNRHHSNHASFYIGFGPHGHVSYGLNIRPHHNWRPVYHPHRSYHRPHRSHQRMVHRSRGYCPVHGGWHR